MNIIIHRYNSICEPDFIEAFKSVGLQVIEDRAEMTDKSIPIKKRVEVLGEMILVNRPLFVFTINFFPYISMICEKLGVRYVCVSVDCPVMELFSTQIKNKCNRVFLFDYMQYLEVRDYNPECIFHMPLGVNVDRINETIGEPDWNQISELEKNKDSGSSGFYKYDISFVGSLYDEKNPFPAMYQKLSDRYKGMCDGFLAAQSMFAGLQIINQSVTDELVGEIKSCGEDFYPSDLSVTNLDRFVAVNDYFGSELTVRDRYDLLSIMAGSISDYGKINLFTRSNTDRLRKMAPWICTHGGVRSLDEMPTVFRQSKINLNPTMRAIEAGLPQRIWDVLGAGGFLLTNYQAELPEYLEIGRHVEAYETPAEACEKAAYYLTHDEERIEIARAGYEEAKTRNTVVNRVIEIISIISNESN